jgi:hypothetical protein
LVVARGLPPEVDHHIYEVRLPHRLAGSWSALADLLSRHGTLTIDGPVQRSEQLLGMTLHFPRLPGREPSGSPEDFRAVDKIRFFPDLAHECLYVVPVVFPPLRVPAADELRRILRTEAGELISASRGSADGIVELLLGRARTLNAKTLFRVCSTAAEVDSVTALAHLLNGAFSGVSIAAHPDSFVRLYGPKCGAEAAACLAERLALAASEAVAVEAPAAEERREAIFLDQEVVETTKLIVRELRRLYSEAMAAGGDRSKRIGLSVAEIRDFLPDADPLLVSRCIDYGMAMTALVPFVGYAEDGGDALVERRYRVSEPLRGEEELPYEDIGDARVALSEQTVAVIAHNVIERSGGQTKAVGQELLTALVAILRPLVLAGHSVPLKVVPGEEGAEILLTDDERRIGIDEKTSSFFDYDIDAKGYVPTPHFLTLYEKGQLPVEVRKSVEDIEARLEMLLPLFDGLDEGERDLLLAGWQMSTDYRLGLTYVRHALESALLDISSSLRQVQRGRDHDHTSFATTASERARSAIEMLDVLAQDWQAPAADKWSQKLALERHFRSSLACPKKPLEFYELASALADLTAEIAVLADRLDALSAAQWTEPEAELGARDLATLTVELSARARRALCSFDDSPIEAPQFAHRHPREVIGIAAAELDHTVKMLRALLAACAGAYRGPEDAHLRQPTELRRHAAFLSLDIAGSRAHRQSRPQTHDGWKNEGLNIAAQWTRAFGGWEGRSRFGDDLLIEFDSGDAAILCGALVQCHAGALYSTGLDAIGREFHAGVDCGQVVTQTGGSTDGDCMDRVTFVAKECDKKAETIDVYATPDVWSFCSTSMVGQPIQVDGWKAVISVDRGETMIDSVAIDSHAVLGHYTERLRDFARQMAQRIVAEAPAVTLIDAVPLNADQGEDAAADSAG